jgi:hypothetical protein
MEVSFPKPIPKYLLELPHTREVTVDFQRDGSAIRSSRSAPSCADWYNLLVWQMTLSCIA